MLSTVRFAVKKVSDARPSLGDPAIFYVFDPARGVGSAPVGMITRNNGPEAAWHAYVGVGIGRRRPVGAYFDAPCGHRVGRDHALRAIARAL